MSFSNKTPRGTVCGHLWNSPYPVIQQVAQIVQRFQVIISNDKPSISKRQECVLHVLANQRQYFLSITGNHLSSPKVLTTTSLAILTQEQALSVLVDSVRYSSWTVYLKGFWGVCFSRYFNALATIPFSIISSFNLKPLWLFCLKNKTIWHHLRK